MTKEQKMGRKSGGYLMCFLTRTDVRQKFINCKRKEGSGEEEELR